MTKTNALKVFEKEAHAASVQQLEKLTKYMLVEQFGDLIQQFVSCFEGYCQKIAKMQQTGEKGALGYIHFSLLYTDILVKKYQLRIDAYDKHYFADRVECVGIYDVGNICSFLDEFSETLFAQRKKYVYKVSVADVRQLVLEESAKYRAAITELIRLALAQATQTSAYQDVLREEQFIISVGGFQDGSAIVYREDYSEKDAKNVRKMLEEGREAGYHYEIVDRLDLSGGKFQNILLTYSTGAGSDFSNSDCQNARILFCKFPEAIFKQVTLAGALVLGTDFSGATLEDVDFQGAKLYQVSFENATLINVDFTKADAIAQMNLTNATLVNTIIPPKKVVS